MIDYDFSIQDFVQGFLEMSLKYIISWSKNHIKNSFRKIVE